MNNFNSISVISICSILILFAFSPQVYSQNQLLFGTISNGGEKQTSKSYVFVGNVGQAITDQSGSTNYHAQAGFWQMFYQDFIQDVEDDEILPKAYKLEQNYPNPFNPSTTIRFGLPERSIVLLKVYDILGREAVTLLNQEMEAGWHKVSFDAASYSSGIYICWMYAGKNIFVKKMMMVK